MSNNVAAYSAYSATSINSAVVTAQNNQAANTADLDAQSGAGGTDSVSLSSKQQPHALLLTSAVNAINEALKPKLGANAIQNAASQDNSSEATASRILAGSTGLFAAFKAQHPDESGDAVVKDFISTIRGGFEKGFGEAAGILGSLGVLDGGLSDAINKTRDLVEKGYDDFEKANLSDPSDDDTTASASASAGSSASATVTIKPHQG